MELISTPLQGLFIIKNNLLGDSRGYFLESFHKKKFEELTGQSVDFVQDNQSLSRKNVVRGLHFQTGEWAQAKLVRVVQGKVLDTVVDIRPESDTFGQSFSFELDDTNEYQLFVPKGFAHGFSVLTEVAVFFYKCDNYYFRDAERGIDPLDADLNINWKIEPGDHLLSEKDKQAKSWADFSRELTGG